MSQPEPSPAELRAEQSLAESRRTLATLMSNLPGMAYRCHNDRDWTMTFVSDGCLDLTGYQPSDLINNSKIAYNQIIHPDDRESVWNDVRSALEANRPFQLTYRIITAGYEERWVWEQGRGVYSAEGELLALEGFITDITAQRRAEQALLEEEERFRVIADYTYDWENWVGTDGKLLWVNPAVERMTGYSVEECLAMPDFPLPLVIEDDRAEAKRTFEGAINGESGSNLPIRIRCKDGSILWIAVNWHPIFNREGVCIGHRSSLRDISEQKRAEEALRASERNYRTTLDSMGDAIHVVGADMRIFLFNATFRKWCRELGQETDVIGRTVAEVFPFLPDKTLGEYEQVFRDQKILVTQEHVTVGDRVLITETRKIPVIEGQKVVRVVTAIRDITERKQAESEKARLEAQLYQAQKLEAIGQLAGGVAHDFNNLLVVIMGNASMLQKDRSLPPKTRDSLADITTAAERGSALTQQLLAYARGGIQKPAATDLNRLVRSIVSILQRTAPARIGFELELGEDLPPIQADPPRIEQVVMNLCLNAVQATKPPGTITLNTREDILDARRAVDLQLKEGRYLRLQVKDSGCGIKPEIRERIFEPFFSTKEMGRGLGLSVTHGIVQSHRGQIRVDSSSDRGTSLSVWLPVTDQPEVAVEPPAFKPKLDRLPRGSETILVIDNEIAITQTAEQILSSLGYCVITRTDADQAIAFLGTNAEDVNLVLCDLTMPGLGGYELATRVARQYPHIAVLLTGGLSDAELAEPLKTSGAIGAIQKPFTLGGLAKAVRNALDQNASAHPPADPEQNGVHRKPT